MKGRSRNKEFWKLASQKCRQSGTPPPPATCFLSQNNPLGVGRASQNVLSAARMAVRKAGEVASVYLMLQAEEEKETILLNFPCVLIWSSVKRSSENSFGIKSSLLGGGGVMWKVLLCQILTWTLSLAQSHHSVQVGAPNTARNLEMWNCSLNQFPFVFQTKIFHI